jgi:hypothetical protein
MLWTLLRYGWGNVGAIFALGLVPVATAGSEILNHVGPNAATTQDQDVETAPVRADTDWASTTVIAMDVASDRLDSQASY